MPLTLIPSALQSCLMYSRSMAVSLVPTWKSSKAQQSEGQRSLRSHSTTSQIPGPGKQQASDMSDSVTTDKSVMSTDGGLHPLQQFPTCVTCLPPAESDFQLQLYYLVMHILHETHLLHTTISYCPRHHCSPRPPEFIQESSLSQGLRCYKECCSTGCWGLCHGTSPHRGAQRCRFQWRS